MHQHIDAGEIARAEGRGFGAGEERAGECVDFTDGEVVVHHRASGDDHAVHAQSVGDEARDILGDDNAFAEDAFLEVAHGVEDVRCRFGRRDDLEEVHVARRIEVVRAAELLAEPFGASLEQNRHRDARGIRGDDRVRRELFDFGEELLLGFRLFDDDFDNPIAIAEQVEMVSGVARGDQGSSGGVHEGRGFILDRFGEPIFGGRGAVG